MFKCIITKLLLIVSFWWDWCSLSSHRKAKNKINANDNNWKKREKKVKLKINQIHWVQLQTRNVWWVKGYEHHRLSPIVVDLQSMQMIDWKTQIISIDSGRFTEANIHRKKIEKSVKISLTFYGWNTDNCNGMLYASVLSTAGPGTLPRINVWVTRNSCVIPWVWLAMFVNTRRWNLIHNWTQSKETRTNLVKKVLVMFNFTKTDG